MGIPLRQGRDFTSADAGSGELRPAIINRLAARTWFGDDRVTGQRLRLDSGGDLLIVGIADNVKTGNLRDAPSPDVYFCANCGAGLARNPLAGGTVWNVAVRAKDTQAVSTVIRQILTHAGNGIVLTRLSPVRDLIDRQLFGARALTAVAGIFSTAGILITVLGVFAMASYETRLRAKEIALRKALGRGIGRCGG